MARSKPLPRSRRTPVINRGLERSRNTDTTKNISIGLMDIDSAIQFYFDNIIKPKVKENGTMVKVPTLYGSPERWAQAQKRGFIYDNKQQLIIPLIVFKRTSIEKDAGLAADKMNPKDPKLFYSFQPIFPVSRFIESSFYPKKSFLLIPNISIKFFVFRQTWIR